MAFSFFEFDNSYLRCTSVPNRHHPEKHKPLPNSDLRKHQPPELMPQDTRVGRSVLALFQKKQPHGGFFCDTEGGVAPVNEGDLINYRSGHSATEPLSHCVL